jgi:hypothetical protein
VRYFLNLIICTKDFSTRSYLKIARGEKAAIKFMFVCIEKLVYVYFSSHNPPAQREMVKNAIIYFASHPKNLFLDSKKICVPFFYGIDYF